MARIALIDANVVTNVIIADLSFAETLGHQLAVESDAANIGDTYTGGVFTPTPVTHAELP